MPMIDVYAAAGTFPDTHALARDLATAVMAVERVPDIPMFRENTAAFVHELPAAAMSNVNGDSTYVRVQVLTNAGALDRDKQLAVTSQLTSIVAEAAGDPITRRPDMGPPDRSARGRLGLRGHANTNPELVAAAGRRSLNSEERPQRPDEPGRLVRHRPEDGLAKDRPVSWAVVDRYSSHDAISLAGLVRSGEVTARQLVMGRADRADREARSPLSSNAVVH